MLPNSSRSASRKLPLVRARMFRLRRVRRLISSMSGLPPRTLSISSSSFASVSAAPFVPMLTVWPPAVSRSMPSKLFGSATVVAVDERVVEQRLHGACLELDDGRFEVLDVRARGLEEVIDIGVAAEDLERGGGLRERRRAFVPGVADIVEGGGGRGVFAVVGEAVADDFDERQALQDGAFGGDRLDHAGDAGCRC